MTWIEGSHQRSLTVNAPKEEVAEFLVSPEQLRECMVELERGEKVDEKTWRWIREEIGAKNITFQADYIVHYQREGDEVRWESQGEGNMRTVGIAKVRELGGGRTEIDYEETVASDLPIPKLMAKIFRPIVARELRKAVDAYLDNIQAYLDAGHHRGDGDA